MKKVTAIAASIAFALGVIGAAAAQTSTAPAPPAAKDDMKKMDKMDKKADKMDKKADKMAAKMADCMTKAGTDDAKKAECEKKYAAKKPASKAEKK